MGYNEIGSNIDLIIGYMINTIYVGLCDQLKEENKFYYDLLNPRVSTLTPKLE